MTNITPLGSGSRPIVSIPVPVPLVASELPAPDAPTGGDAPESPSTPPTPDTTAPSGDDSSASGTAGTATTTEPFDVTQFHDAFAALKQQVADRRATLTQDISALKAEDEQLVALLDDLDRRYQEGEARRGAIEPELNAKLDEFASLDEATQHLEATDALLYPTDPAETSDASTGGH